MIQRWNEEQLDYLSQGYLCGYNWLRVKANPFVKHPSEKGGYIPGGPLVFPKTRPGDSHERKQAAYHYASTCNKLWTKGFILGINTWVQEAGLTFPQIGFREVFDSNGMYFLFIDNTK